MSRALFALVAAVLMLGAAGPAVAITSAAETAGNTEAGNTGIAVDVTQDDDVTVHVTYDNGTDRGVSNATVIVETVNKSATYAGSGTNTTDENGTVVLPTPEEHVRVTVTAEFDGATASTTVTLTAGDDAYKNFGQSVSAFVSTLDPSGMDGPPGRLIAAFVVANNPSDSVPDDAGPPEDGGDGEAETEDDEAESEDDGEAESEDEDDEKEGNGPPDDRGNGKDKTDSEDGKEGNGPPEDRGNNGKGHGQDK